MREELSPSKRIGDAAAGWTSLKRWAGQACSGELWQAVGTTLGAGLRGQAERVMRQLEGLGPAKPRPEESLRRAAYQNR